MTDTQPFALLLFDLGGVINDIDRAGLMGAAASAGLDPVGGLRFWRSAYESGDDNDHPIHRAERGEIDHAEFLRLAEAAATGASFVFDPASAGYLMRFLRPAGGWAEIVAAARAGGLRVGVLTNTMDGLDEAHARAINPEIHAHTEGLFGRDVLESHVLRARKPSPEAFRAACAYFGVEPAQVVFIDDEAGNCAGAEAIGMTAVHNVEPTLAQQDVCRLLGIEFTQ